MVLLPVVVRLVPLALVAVALVPSRKQIYRNIRKTHVFVPLEKANLWEHT